MANFTSQDVMKLREQTGVGMMDCKKALVQTDGNFEEAIKYLREKGMASAAKKASRVAAEGLVKCVVSADKKSGVAVEINCETDFVARSDQFLELIAHIANHLLQSNATTVEEVLAEPYYLDTTKTISVLIAEATASIGEKNFSAQIHQVRFGRKRYCCKLYPHGRKNRRFVPNQLRKRNGSRFAGTCIQHLHADCRKQTAGNQHCRRGRFATCFGKGNSDGASQKRRQAGGCHRQNGGRTHPQVLQGSLPSGTGIRA